MIRRPPRSTLFPYTTLFRSISMVNAQLEGAESLLGNLRGELLALDTNLSPGSLESGLVHLKERVSQDRKSTRLNSSHANISYAVFCLKKKTTGANAPLPMSQ